MQLEFAAFAFIFTLAAVVNGLGIVRWLTALAEYVRHQDSIKVANFGVFLAFAVYQFLLHILLWWSLWSIRGAEAFNFLHYLFMLAGPILLFLSTSLLVPDADDAEIDLSKHFERIRRPYATTLAGAWIWALLLWPVLIGIVPPTAPYHVAFVLMAIVLRFSTRPAVHGTLAVLNWIALIALISGYAMELGGFVGQL